MAMWHENEILAGKLRFGGKMAGWAGKWRAWRVALNQCFLLIFKSRKSAGKWQYGGQIRDILDTHRHTQTAQKN